MSRNKQRKMSAKFGLNWSARPAVLRIILRNLAIIVVGLAKRFSALSQAARKADLELDRFAAAYEAPILPELPTSGDFSGYWTEDD